jgi:hypothetical protein
VACTGRPGTQTSSSRQDMKIALHAGLMVSLQESPPRSTLHPNVNTKGEAQHAYKAQPGVSPQASPRCNHRTLQVQCQQPVHAATVAASIARAG